MASAFVSNVPIRVEHSELASFAPARALAPVIQQQQTMDGFNLALLAGVSVGASVVGHRTKRRHRAAGLRASKVENKTVEVATGGSFPPQPTPLLDSLGDKGPGALRKMNLQELNALADEVRFQVLDVTSKTGGHLGSALGVVELTVALHHVFDTPRDEICWDVAHQVYPHKVLTGRRDRIYTLRSGGGLSGFAKMKESEYDAFGAGHSTTAISAALGYQAARELEGRPGHSIAVVGDGAITGGMAWEAMNHAGGLKSKVMVILNDNGQVSLPTFYNSVTKPVGALSETLAGTESEAKGLRLQDNIAKFETSDNFQDMRQMAKNLSQSLPWPFATTAAKVDEYARDFVKTAPFRGSGAGSKCALFEELGFYYVGPIDGHDIETLVEVMQNLKRQHEDGRLEKPVFLHIKTVKGKGYAPAERASDKLHAVKPNYNIPKEPAAPGDEIKVAPLSLTKIMANQLVKEGEVDKKIVAITAAMPDGTGISTFEKRFPLRTYDVGIAEQHAVTFAAGLAAGGLKPFCAIYSTFLQRGYDQVVHDVAIQQLPVRLLIDRAGLVGADGPTHAGSFDLTYLSCLPNMLVCASADEQELVHMVHTIAKIDDYPTALRYPRGEAYGDEPLPESPKFLEPGVGRVVREGRDNKLVLLSIGSRLRECLEAANRLESWGISVTVADARWAKPLDGKLIEFLASEHGAMITIEENSVGGFGSQVQQHLLDGGFLDGQGSPPLVLRSMVLPDRYIDHDLPQKQYDDAELNATHIVSKAVALMSKMGIKVEAP
uniref:1-deoxy-D-xylulose-5-phosphate synthase n=1 Tax=Noctiluca scintillans TaxID=2966 RepID=A0A7S1AG86_NOCSC